MSQAALFGFGSVIFFIVMTGVFLYGMAVVGEIFDRDTRVRLAMRCQPLPSHYSSTDEEDAWWEAIK